MKLMVACTVLTWIEVDTETREVGPARVFNLPENVDVEGVWTPHSYKKKVVLVVDPLKDDEEAVTPELEKLAVELVQSADTYEFALEER